MKNGEGVRVPGASLERVEANSKWNVGELNAGCSEGRIPVETMAVAWLVLRIRVAMCRSVINVWIC